MIDGVFRHQDSNGGGGGLITDGDTQWMTAGAGLSFALITPPDQHCLVRLSLIYLAQCPRNPTEESSAPGVRSFEAGAGPAITLLCPCPGVCAPQLASKPPATRPHNATRCTVSRRSHPPAEQRGYEVTRGKVVCCERLARQWHARGQGFKSPQLHPRSEARSSLGRTRIARPGQQIGSNRRCAGRSVAHRSAIPAVRLASSRGLTL